MGQTLSVFLFACYGVRADTVAAITVFPAWAWLVPGLLLAAIGVRRRGTRSAILVLATWVFFVLIQSDEPGSLVRAMIPLKAISRSRVPGQEVVRVVSLNCAIGSRPAAEEVLSYRPDIVLLQESPNRPEVEALARRLFGTNAGVVHGVDASLIVNGRAIPSEIAPAQRGYFVEARVTLASGREMEVVSLRLLPALFRADLWSPECWREQAENRRKRRAQLRVIAGRVAFLDVPVLVGGDFNAPQGDAAFRVLRPLLRDAFAEAGRGWGDTITNDLPFLRIDQIWISRAFRTHAVVARKTRHSDHRIVVCDLILRES